MIDASKFAKKGPIKLIRVSSFKYNLVFLASCIERFEASNGTILSIYKDFDGAAVLPEYYQNIQIQCIGANACYTGLIRELDLSQTKIVRIQYNAFFACKKLIRVVFPNTLTTLEDNSFYLTAMKELFIPAATTKFTAFAINQAFNLNKIDVDTNNPSFISINDCIYTRNLTKLVKIANYIKIQDILYFDQLTTIGEFAFAGSSNITEFIGTKNLKVVEKFTFHRLTILETVDLSLTAIKSIPVKCFYNLPKLSTIILPLDLESMAEYSIGWLPLLESYFIPPSVTSISNNATFDCVNLRIISYLGKTNLSDQPIIVNCPSISEIRVIRSYPSNKFGYYDVKFTAYNYLLFEKCRTVYGYFNYHLIALISPMIIL